MKSSATTRELGPPTVVGPPGANSPENCCGTNLATNYGLGSNIWLRTPPGALDPTDAAGATLTFQQWVDTDPFEQADSGTVRILDATGLPGTVTELAVVEAGITGLDPAGWAEFTAELPAEVLGKSIVLEFHFVSDDDNMIEGPGWYIDDVLVIKPGSWKRSLTVHSSRMAGSPGRSPFWFLRKVAAAAHEWSDRSE